MLRARTWNLESNHINGLRFVLIALLVVIVFQIGDQNGDIITFTSKGEFFQSDINEGLGEIEYDAFLSNKIWSSNTDAPFSSFVKNDIDGDGSEEVIFGTINGRIIIISYAKDRELLNISVSDEPILYCAIGNIDDDESSEIIVVSLDNVVSIIDVNSSDVQWKSVQYSQIHSLILFSESPTEVQDDIILVYDTSIVRIRNNTEVFTSPLEGFQNAYGISVSWAIYDVDMDFQLEIVIITRGFNSEFGIKGQQIWIFDYSSGDTEFSYTYSDVIFYSNPYPYMIHGESYLAIGLFDNSYNENLYDLMILNGFSKQSTLIDVVEDTRVIRWRYIFSLGLATGDLILCTDDGDLISWSIENESIIWESTRITTNLIYQPPIVCDIDSDAILEILIPTGQVVVVNSATGEKETLLYIAKGGISGRRLLLGDFDSDEYTEICFGHNETLYTQSYEIFIVDTPRIDIEYNVSMIPLDKYFFAGRPHKIGFIVTTMTQSRIPTDFNIIIMNPTLGPVLDIIINTTSSSITNQIQLYIEANGMNSSFKEPIYYLEIQIVPAWNMSSDEFNNISFIFEDRLHRIQERTFEDCFRVERDLILYGDFEVGCNRGILNSYDWIRHDEKIYINSFTIVYENTNSVHPPSDSYLLELSINDEGRSFEILRTEPYKIEFLPNSSSSMCNLSLSIFQVPIRIYSRSYYNITLRIDLHPPNVIQFFPENNTWFSSTNIIVAIHIVDNESGVDTSRIKYNVLSNLGDIENGRWNYVDIQYVRVQSDGIIIELEVNIPEGKFIFIWNITDELGNFIHFYHIIKVDLTNIVFTDFNPVNWINTTNVISNVTITDINGSGVDGGSIQYSYSTGDIFNFTEWSSTIHYSSSESILISVKFSGEEGINNRIRYRGRDIAGNEVLSSELYSVWIDTTPPVIISKYPHEGNIIPPTEKYIEIIISENGSGLNEITPTINQIPNGLPLDFSVNITSISNMMSRIILKWNDNSSRYSFSIRCVDRAGNIAQSKIIEFGVNQPPEVDFISPLNQSSFFYGDDINFQASIRDPEEAVYSITWMLNGIVFLSSDIMFINNSLPLGTHEITLTVQDEYYIISKTIIIDIVEKETTDEYSTDNYYIIIFIIIIAIIVSFISIRYLKKSYTKLI